MKEHQTHLRVSQAEQDRLTSRERKLSMKFHRFKLKLDFILDKTKLKINS